MSRVEIVAELANAHQGNPDLAARMAEECLAAGADAVKFQIYFAEELLIRAHPRFEHFRNQAFAPDIWRRLIGQAKAAGGRVYCDLFGMQALEVAANNDADGFKIHSSDLTNLPLLQAVAGLGKRVFLSSGGSTAREIAYALEVLCGRGLRPVLLHGFQSYPTAVEDSVLSRITWLKDTFGAHCDIGYQDHVAGDDPFAVSLPLLAMGMGATVLEKHVTLDRGAKGVDYYSSLEPTELAAFIRTVRRAESALGERPDGFSAAERQYRDTVKKHWVAVRALPAGKILAPDDLVMKRVPDAKAGAVELERLVGRVLLRDVESEHVFSRADVKNEVWAMVVARSRSSRLPGKALLDMAGMPALQHLFERLKQARRIDKVVFCTTVMPEDDPLAQLARSAGIHCHRGPVEDVLGRMLGATAGHEVDLMLRVTGDDILVDPDYADQAVEHHLSVNAEYTDHKALPSGTEVEVFDARLLSQIHALSRDPQGTEYLTFYITHHRDQFRTASAPVAEGHAHDWRLTLDTSEDYQVIHTLLRAMRELGKGLTYRMDDITAFFRDNPQVLAVNAGVRQRQAPPEVDTAIEWNRLLKRV